MKKSEGGTITFVSGCAGVYAEPAGPGETVQKCGGMQSIPLTAPLSALEISAMLLGLFSSSKTDGPDKIRALDCFKFTRKSGNEQSFRGGAFSSGQGRSQRT